MTSQPIYCLHCARPVRPEGTRASDYPAGAVITRRAQTCTRCQDDPSWTPTRVPPRPAHDRPCIVGTDPETMQNTRTLLSYLAARQQRIAQAAAPTT